jgi:CRISPR-associated protein Csd2
MLPSDITDKFEVFDDRHALTILEQDFKEQFESIIAALRDFQFSREDILKGGGSESDIPKKFSQILTSYGWKKETKLVSKIVADDTEVSSDTHFIDYTYGSVACDIEWNSKDQTFDRDLYALRNFFECRRIDVGIIITRSSQLQELFKSLGIHKKYGASTTHLNKLTPRIKSGRNGGCPVLAFGITEKCLIET